ncbi:DUF7553 family protein [Halogeometricum limi]|uniref:Uncharacterized protein n=1 Tax=Halogeometricum limi TaxID=555875 RepID=A0A1I6FRY4_9EURY|nr:hypothetical protein [Halogeometricum limi]SFR32557.1 hypothetical protein SAMN04488124_0143 [Halogeometricum limi]
MTRELLAAASDDLNAAADASDDDGVRDRLAEQADALSKLADAERGPDHGRLDRHMNILAEIAETTEGDVSERVTAARDKVFEYRKGVEGV